MKDATLGKHGGCSTFLPYLVKDQSPGRVQEEKQACKGGGTHL